MFPSGMFARIERNSLRRPGLVFGIAALLVALSAWCASHLKLDTDILSMVPENNKTIGVFKQSLKEFGSLDYFLILVAAPDDGPALSGGSTAEDYEDFADAFASELTQLDGIEYVEHRLDETSPIFRNLAENALVFAGPGRLPEIRALYSDEAIRGKIAELRESLASQPSFVVKLQAQYDPIGMLPILYESVLKNRGAFRIDLADGYYLSTDRKALLIIAKPKRPPQDVTFSHRLKDAIDAAQARAAAAIRAQAGEGEPDPLAGMSVSYGGGYMIAVDDSDLIKGDIVWNATVSFALVVLLYLFCYRRLAAIAYSTIPLAVGQALTFSVAWLVLSGLNSATSGFTALLMGLGTDFTIVMYGRYIEERRAGHSMEAAVSRIMGETALGVFTGVITSAGTFYAMCVTQLPGLRDFGFLVGTGILLCGAAILFLLPAMIAYVEGEKVSRISGLWALFVFPALPLPLLRWWERRRLAREGKVRRLYLHSFGVENLLKLAGRWPWPTAIGSAAICLTLGVFALDIDFSQNIKDLRSPNNRGVRVQEEVTRRFGGSLNYLMIMCHGATLDDALARNREVVDRLQPLVAAGEIQGYESLLSYLPPRDAQEQVIAALQPGSPGAFDLDRIERVFRAALEENGFRPGAYDDYLKGLRRTLRPEKLLTIDDLEQGELRELAGRYHRAAGGEHLTATYVFPAPGHLDAAQQQALVGRLEAGNPAIQVTSVALVGLELRALFRGDAVKAVGLGLLIVAILLYIDFRKLSLTFFAMLQLATGVVAMLGAMRLFDIQMNFVNAFATTMILGVGVDYGIHILHRLARSEHPSDEGVLETGKAVVMAALTNVAGFGTVAFSNYPGLRSVGLVCVLGTLGCLFTSLTLLPALMVIKSRRAARAGVARPIF